MGLLLLCSLNLNVQAQDVLTSVSVQLKWSHQFQFAGFYTAIEEGYYRDAGLEVKLQEYRPGLSPIDQLSGGRVEFAIGDTGALIYRANGVPVVALDSIFQHSPSTLMVLERPSIQHLEDLKGKRVMLAGGFMNAELMAMLATADISADDVKVSSGSTNIRLLTDGHTDAFNAYTTNEPYPMQEMGMPYRLFKPRDYGVDFYGDTLLTLESTIREQPDMVHAFRKATLRGWRTALDDIEASVELIFNQYNSQNKTREHLLYEARESRKLILPDLVHVGYMNRDRWQKIANTFHNQQHIMQKVDIDEFLYTETTSAWQLVINHKKKIALLLATLLILITVLHIYRLKVQIRNHTRDLRAARELAEHEARTDALTMLPNRRHFIETLERSISQAQRHQWPLSVISLDIDRFKKINDQYGHAAGDQTLRQVGEIFRSYIRDSDSIARTGGEEFAVICLNSTPSETYKLADRLCQAIASTPIHWRDTDFKINLSGGIAPFQTGDDIEVLLRKADLALYYSKNHGRKQITEWRSELDQSYSPGD